MRDAKKSCDAKFDQTREQKIVNRETVRQELWDRHLLNPALAITEALRRVDVCDDAGSSTQEGVEWIYLLNFEAPFFCSGCAALSRL